MMRRCSILVQVLFFFCGLSLAFAEEGQSMEEEAGISFESLEIKKSAFGNFSMLAQERDDYATTLAKLAIETIHADPKDEANLESARQLLALALHLSPRNRTAVVSNHQLGRGMLPEQKEADYSRPVFARLLLTRGRVLKKQASEGDQAVGSCFVELAAALDPRNEEAIYDFEIQKLDGDEVDWSVLTKGAQSGE